MWRIGNRSNCSMVNPIGFTHPRGHFTLSKPLELSSSTTSYKLTVTHGILAVVIMYASQILSGICFSYGVRYIDGISRSAAETDFQLIGMLSVLTGGTIVLLLFGVHSRIAGKELLAQIGCQPSKLTVGSGLSLVVVVLTATHLFAWVYRSVLLPLVGQGGIVGGGSQMFAYIRATGSIPAMAAFLLLALLVGPMMEEVIFRGYLQSSLTRRMPQWAAVSVASLVFMAGHSPVVLWPMYFVYGAAWGWVFIRTGALRMAIVIHVLSNLFYTVVGFARWDILA